MYVCVCVCVCVCVYVVCMYLADDLRCVLRAAAMKGDGEMVCRRALPGVCLFFFFFFFLFSVFCFLFLLYFGRYLQNCVYRVSTLHTHVGR